MAEGQPGCCLLAAVQDTPALYDPRPWIPAELYSLCLPQLVSPEDVLDGELCTHVEYNDSRPLMPLF